MRLSWICRLNDRSPSACKSGVTIWLSPLVVACRRATPRPRAAIKKMSLKRFIGRNRIRLYRRTREGAITFYRGGYNKHDPVATALCLPRHSGALARSLLLTAVIVYARDFDEAYPGHACSGHDRRCAGR